MHRRMCGLTTVWFVETARGRGMLQRTFGSRHGGRAGGRGCGGTRKGERRSKRKRARREEKGAGGDPKLNDDDVRRSSSFVRQTTTSSVLPSFVVLHLVLELPRIFARSVSSVSFPSSPALVQTPLRPSLILVLPSFSVYPTFIQSDDLLVYVSDHWTGRSLSDHLTKVPLQYPGIYPDMGRIPRFSFSTIYYSPRGRAGGNILLTRLWPDDSASIRICPVWRVLTLLGEPGDNSLSVPTLPDWKNRELHGYWMRYNIQVLHAWILWALGSASSVLLTT